MTWGSALAIYACFLFVVFLVVCAWFCPIQILKILFVVLLPFPIAIAVEEWCDPI